MVVSHKNFFNRAYEINSQSEAIHPEKLSVFYNEQIFK